MIPPEPSEETVTFRPVVGYVTGAIVLAAGSHIGLLGLAGKDGLTKQPLEDRVATDLEGTGIGLGLLGLGILVATYRNHYHRK